MRNLKHIYVWYQYADIKTWYVINGQWGLSEFQTDRSNICPWLEVAGKGNTGAVSSYNSRHIFQYKGMDSNRIGANCKVYALS